MQCYLFSLHMERFKEAPLRTEAELGEQPIRSWFSYCELFGVSKIKTVN